MTKDQYRQWQNKATTPKNYRTRQWRRLARAILARATWLCQINITPGCTKDRPRVATEVDHIKPVSTHPELTFEPSNLQAACRHCNRAKGGPERGRKKHKQ